MVYGLGPYFKEELIKSIKGSLYFSLLFDESLDRELQEEQMGVHMRFWNDSAGEVQTRYLDPMFFKRPKCG